MLVQTFTKPVFVCNLISVSSDTDCSSVWAAEVSSRDGLYGIDEEELAKEMSACLPGNLLDQQVPDIAPDDFESIYGWFLA